MITPRRTRLIRVPDLRSFQRAIATEIPEDEAGARDCAVIVPTTAAGDELRAAVPRMRALTRDEFYDALRIRLPGAPAAISRFEREVLLRRAARAAAESGHEPPFNLRPGLIAEVLALYDELRRRHRTVADFDRLMTGALSAGAEYDRGAARLLQQTRFLVAAFEAFESAMASAPLDEHAVRAAALRSPDRLFAQVIVTTADQPADRRGLWTADYDLLARLPGLERLDIVATENVLDAGYYHRLHDHLLPGIEDDRRGDASPLPILLVPEPAPGADAARYFTSRDREEELADCVRLGTSPRRHGAGPLAFVFQRPLPYLYLARQVCADAGMPYEAVDSLPLAAEPFAAAVDLLFAAASAGFTRGALLELLRSPHFTFAERVDLGAIDRRLVARKYFGGVERLNAIAAEDAAVAVAAAAASALAAAFDAPSAPAQIDGLLAFLAAHERLPADDAPWRERHLRARDAVLAALTMLRNAHARHDQSPLTVWELSGAVRRWIDSQTFAPRVGGGGLRLLDVRAAAYADVDDVRLAGLVESDWPERAPRSIFYPQSLLGQLGWPPESDRIAAGRAQFADLLRLPRRRVSISTFTLEEDGLVAASPLLEDIEAAGLPVERYVAAAGEPSPFAHDALRHEPPRSSAVAGTVAADWLALRASRTPADAPRFHGQTSERAATTYAVSRVERYLDCPFRYFAASVLKLPEERDEQVWLTPQERGEFVHEVFREFFDAWQAAGRGAITIENVSDALIEFEAVAERRIGRLAEGDRALERTLLLGSAAAAGLAERAFAFEIEQGIAVRERLLEHELDGLFTVSATGQSRSVRIRSKADRIDLLEDGTLRILDYKLGRAPDRKRALQLPIYGVCAEQSLKGRHGRMWKTATAGYIAFREKAAFSPLSDVDEALAAGQARFLAAIDGIEHGTFPVRPDDLFLCNWCAYPSVCRKDYVGDE